MTMRLPSLNFFFLSVLALSVNFVAMGCKEKKTTVINPNKPAAVKPAVFSPPLDGIITPRMAAAYALARAEMVEVNTRLLDSLGMASPERKAVFAQALDMACEKIARRHNLRGAPEYRWIQENATALPQNREALAQVGIYLP